MALSQLVIFGNYSLPTTTQSCQLTRDYFTFDVVNCGLYLTNQPVPNNTCVVLLFNPNITNTVNNRVT